MTEGEHKYSIYVELPSGGTNVYTTYDKNDIVTVKRQDSYENQGTNDEAKGDSEPVTADITIEELLQHEPHVYYDCEWETVIEVEYTENESDDVNSEDSEEERDIHHTSIFYVVGYKRNPAHLQYTQVHAPAFQFRIRLA